MHPHPWRALRGFARVRLVWRSDLPDDVISATDGERIYMRHDLSQVERRCALAHELAHVRRGEGTCQPEEVERVVDNEAARFLLPDIHTVADALVWAGGHIGEAADSLWVTRWLLRARLDRRHLHPAEVAILRERTAAADPTP